MRKRSCESGRQVLTEVWKEFAKALKPRPTWKNVKNVGCFRAEYQFCLILLSNATAKPKAFRLAYTVRSTGSQSVPAGLKEEWYRIMVLTCIPLTFASFRFLPRVKEISKNRNSSRRLRMVSALWRWKAGSKSLCVRVADISFVAYLHCSATPKSDQNCSL